MKYEPIKASLGNVFNKHPYLRVFFYKLLDLLLLRAWHINKELKKLRKQIGEEANCLDGGAGFGQHTYTLSGFSKKWNITSVDIIPEQVEDCNRFFAQIGKGQQVKYIQADLTKYVNPGAYNLIISVDVMEHILDDVAVFKNFSSSLKPGGVLLISTPSDQGGSDVHEEHGESFIAEHVRDGYNINEIEEKLISSGFSKVVARYQYGTPGKISWKLSMKYPISMLNIGKAFFILLPLYYIITFPVSLLLNYLDVIGNHKTGTGLIVKAYK
jgi:SAM-dependent methyltransferase